MTEYLEPHISPQLTPRSYRQSRVQVATPKVAQRFGPPSPPNSDAAFRTASFKSVLYRGQWARGWPAIHAPLSFARSALRDSPGHEVSPGTW